MPDYETVAYITSSSYRAAILEQLADDVLTPSAIAARTDLRASHVSRTLGDLRQEGLVDLAVDEDRTKHRYYQITDEGERVWDEAKDHL